ncbi:MAG: DUF4157 domain-containing protein [Kofleriaceae bacterium]
MHDRRRPGSTADNGDDGARDGAGRGPVQRRTLPRTTAGLPLQRKASASTAPSASAIAEAGTRSAGGPLPFLDSIQRSFGRHDVSGVTAHTDDGARTAAGALGADAFATGDQVAFGRTPDLHTAAHEAAHVVQQRAGVHLAGGLDQPGDRYEQHADQVADRVVRGQSAEGLLDTMAAGGGGAGAGATVQRMVSVGGADLWGAMAFGRKLPEFHVDSDVWLPTDYYPLVMRALQALPKEMAVPEQQLQAMLPKLAHVLEEWVLAGNPGVTNVILGGGTAHGRNYADWQELGRALLGDTKAKDNKAKEAELAKRTHASGGVRGGVAACMQLINAQVATDFGEGGKFEQYAAKMKKSVGALRKEYWWWYLGQDIFTNLANPTPAKLDRNISIIHDLEGYFRSAGRKVELDGFYGDWQKRDRKGTVGEDPDDGGSKLDLDGDLGDYRKDDQSTLKEDNAWVRTARAHSMPVWAGPSVTTGRMLTFAQACGAGGGELTALAWGLWAFWTTSYFTSFSWVHTFHEVMDVARGFGVAYTPFEYPDDPPL